MNLCPITFAEARAFIQSHHRHHEPPVSWLFGVALEHEGTVVGVATVGRPVARMLQDGYTAELTRLCAAPVAPKGACSMMARACWRAARALGYRRLVTYTLKNEGGGSLRGAAFRLVGEAGGGSWSRKHRPRVDTHPTQVKLRWEITES